MSKQQSDDGTAATPETEGAALSVPPRAGRILSLQRPQEERSSIHGQDGALELIVRIERTNYGPLP